MTDRAFCEQCGAQIVAHAKHCRSCGAAQSELAQPLARPPEAQPAVAAARVPPPSAAAPPLPPSPAAPAPPAWAGPPTAGPPEPGADLLATAEDLRRAASARLAGSLGSFPGRSLGEILGFTAVGGLIACVCSWLLAWLLLALGLSLADVDTTLLSLSSAAGLLVPLALGAPLAVDTVAEGEIAAATFGLPLTTLVLVPLAIVVVVAFAAGRLFSAQTADQAWKLGVLIAIPFAVGVSLLAASFGGPLEPGVLAELDADDTASIDVGPAGAQTFFYSLFWGALGGALGGRLAAYGLPRSPGRARGSPAVLGVIGGSLRALRFALVATLVLLVISIPIALLVQALRGDLDLGLEQGEVVGLILGVPLIVTWTLLASHGVGYGVDGSESQYAEFIGPLADEQTTFHFWDAGPTGLLLLILTAAIVLALARGGRAAAHAATPASPAAYVWRGAALALPWVAILLVLRAMTSFSGSAASGELLNFEGTVGPILAETVLLGGLIAALAGAWGGRLAWQEDHSSVAASPWHRFLLGPRVWPTGAPDRPSSGPAPAPPLSPAPTPAPPFEPPARPVAYNAPSAFCPYCGETIAAADRFCGACGRDQPVSVTPGPG